MKLLLLLISLSFFSTVYSQDSIASHYKIYDVKTKQLISVDRVVADMSKADVLFFGELHDDSVGHFLEHKIFEALYQAYGGKLALSLEMFETDNQLVLNEYLEGKIDEKRLAKDARLWNNYKDYRPMVEFAKANKLPVIAANPPRRYVSMVSKGGMQPLLELSKDAKKLLPPLPYDTLPGRYREKFFETMKGSPGGDNPKVYYSQCLWDAGMSYSIYKFLKHHKGKKVFHCVGGFHTSEKLGTAAQLLMRNKKLRILNIATVRDENFNKPDWDKLASLGDYIILTDPAVKKTF
ncbi:MAG TPA: ChaN family lipoprotein [Chitinophagaceae bacterium]|jgi:uncharacterized iron-regulated protein|nr:ChaN family lipoprotein [Chitinophagaceae bacterium]